MGSPAPLGQILENLTQSMEAAPSSTITTSGPLPNDIRLGPGITPPLSLTRNKILDLPLPEDGVDPLGHPSIRRQLSLADFTFIGNLSTWIDSKDELESLAISLRWDLHRVDRALCVIPEFDKVRRLLLFEWFSKQMLSSSIPKLRRAFVAQGKGQWIDGLIKFKWYTDGKEAEIKPTRSPPCQTRFLYDITKVVNRGYDDAYLESLASDLELDTGKTLAIRTFFTHIFSAVVFYTLEDWCQSYDEHHSLIQHLNTLRKAFTKMGDEDEYLKIQAEFYQWVTPEEPCCKKLRIQSPPPQSRSFSPTKGAPKVKPPRKSKSVTPIRPLPTRVSPRRPWKLSLVTYTCVKTWTPDNAKMEPKIDVTTIDWHVLYFLCDVADLICNESDGMARSLLYDVSTLEANLCKWPDKFDWIVLLTLVTWYKRAMGTIQVKVESLHRAF